MKVYFRVPDHTRLLQSHDGGFQDPVTVATHPPEGEGDLLSIVIPKPVFERYEHFGARPKRQACIPPSTLNRFISGMARIKTHALVLLTTMWPLISDVADIAFEG
jgi:hypothetical protein